MCGLDHRARWAWLSAHLRADFLGLVEYPISLWSADAEINQANMSPIVEALVKARLIDWSPDYDMVRIIGFIKQRPPANASVAKGLCQDLIDMLYDADGDLEAMLLATSAELAVASIARSLRWANDRARFRDEIGEFLRGTEADFGERFMDALLQELEGAARPTQSEMEALLPTLSLHRQNTVSAQSQHHADTQDVDETRHRQDENRNENKNEDLYGVNRPTWHELPSVPKSDGFEPAVNGSRLIVPRPETLAMVRLKGW